MQGFLFMLFAVVLSLVMGGLLVRAAVRARRGVSAFLFAFLGAGAAFMLFASRASAAVTPESVLSWWNGYLASAMVLVGVIYKFVPAFRNWTNAAIPWLNVLVGILPGLVQLLTPPAHAGVGPEAGAAVVGLGDVVFKAFVHSATASVIWETFGRSLLQGILGIKPPRPTA